MGSTYFSSCQCVHMASGVRPVFSVMDVRGDFVCESGGRLQSEVGARFHQGPVSEIALGWKCNDKLDFTAVRSEFK